MITPTDSDVGRRVTYIPNGHGGLLQGFNAHYAFVAFDTTCAKTKQTIPSVHASATTFDELDWAPNG